MRRIVARRQILDTADRWGYRCRRLHIGLNNSHECRRYDSNHLETTALDFDPAHDSASIDNRAMARFVASAAARLAVRGFRTGDPGYALGYSRRVPCGSTTT